MTKKGLKIREIGIEILKYLLSSFDLHFHTIYVRELCLTTLPKGFALC